MKLIKGSDLTLEQKKQVLNAFVHRFHAIGKGKFYKNEAEWLNDHAFYFTKNGKLSAKHKYCEPHYLAD